MPQTLEQRLKSRLVETLDEAARQISSQAVSGYLVKRFVAPGSFKNTFAGDGSASGFEVKVKNKLGVATVVGCTPIRIDGEIFNADVITIKKGGQLLRADRISEFMPLSVSFGDELFIMVADDQGLEAGNHELQLGLKMVGLGLMEVKYEDSLSGEGRPRVKKNRGTGRGTGVPPGQSRRQAGPTAGPTAAPEAHAGFDDIMRRTVEMTIANVGEKTLAEAYNVLSGIVLCLEDVNAEYGVGILPEGKAEFVLGPIPGDRILFIRAKKIVFHNMATNRLSPGIAFARGDVRLEGVPLLKLRGLDPVLSALFQSYRAASEGVEFEQAARTPGAGIIEDIIGIAITAVDEALRGMDKFLNLFGVRYTYEKTLNRIESVWDILDREIREKVSFGRAEEKPRTGAEGARKPEAETGPARPEAAPGSLHQRLRERITAVVETAVAEISRVTVSDFLVKRLIVPGSFRNFGTPDEIKGFEVKIKNKLGVATVIGFGTVAVDGEVYSLDLIEITKDKAVIPASMVSNLKPLSVTFGDEILIRVLKAGGIGPGKHRIALGLDMVGLGGMDVDFEEELNRV